jgi:hypothetical protein
LVAYGKDDGIAPAQNSTAIASRIQTAELRGHEGGHGFLFEGPAAMPGRSFSSSTIKLRRGWHSDPGLLDRSRHPWR